MRTYSQSLNLIGDGPTVTGYLKGTSTYLEEDIGAATTSFALSDLTNNTWESIGPTGSSPDNTWTALDVVPSGAKWVELVIQCQFNSTTDNGYLFVHGRVTGSSTAKAASNRKANVYIDAAGSTSTDASSTTTAKIPVDSSRRFDCLRDLSGAGLLGSNIYLSGWGI